MGDFGEQFREVIPRGRLLRIGLLFLGSGLIVILAVILLGESLEDTGPLISILVGAAAVSGGVLCCGAALIVRFVRRRTR